MKLNKMVEISITSHFLRKELMKKTNQLNKNSKVNKKSLKLLGRMRELIF